jgi:hypothetical protein
MRSIQKGIIFQDQKAGSRQSAAFPGICALQSGRWVSTFRTAPEKKTTRGQNVSVCWSDDEGKSWSPPIEPFLPAVHAGKPGLFRGGYCTELPDNRLAIVLCWVDHSNPELPFYNEETEGLLDTKIFLSFSADEGETWETPVRVDTAPFTVPTPITGPILVHEDEWILQLELNKHYYETEKWLHSSVLMFSRDQGASWPDYHVVSHDPEVFYWDQRPGIMRDGSILDLFWTFDNKAAVYRNIHSRRSPDGGHSWEELIDTGVPGQPAQPVDLVWGENLCVMVYIDRTAAPTVKLCFSRDKGATWTHEQVLYEHRTSASQQYKKDSMNEAWEEMGKFSVGLPCTAKTRSGDLLVSFYAGDTTNHTGIHWICIPAGQLSYSVS